MNMVSAFRAIMVASGCIALAACSGSRSSGGNEADDRPTDSNSKYTQAGGAAFPSCYEATAIGVDALKPNRHIFVVIDRTTAFDPKLVKSIKEKVSDFLAAGPAAVTIDSFSAQTRDDFTKEVFSGTVERPLSEAKRSSLSARRVDALDRCLGSAGKLLAERAANEIDEVASDNPGSFANSEILASLSQVSNAVKASPAKDKVVLVASDMLEHSSAMSFYNKKQIANIDWQSAMQSAANANLLGDFGDARIAVIGAGQLPPDAEKTTTRDTTALKNLRTFWQNWFTNSGAEIDQSHYGQPDLMVDL